MKNETNQKSAAEMLEQAKTTLLAKMGCNTFDPDVFLTNLAAEIETPNFYLEVKYRILWFRVANPDGRIETELLSLKDGLAIVKATVVMSNGTVLACSHGTCVVGDGQDPYKSIETAETKAIGRALNLSGYGTVYCGAELAAPVCEAPVRVSTAKILSTDNAKPQPNIVKEAPVSTFDINECLSNLRNSMTEKEALEVICPFKKYGGMSVKQITKEKPHALKWTVDEYNPREENGARYKVACEIILNRCIEAEQNRGA